MKVIEEINLYVVTFSECLYICVCTLMLVCARAYVRARVIEIIFLVVIRKLLIRTELEVTEHQVVTIAFANEEGISVTDKNQN